MTRYAHEMLNYLDNHCSIILTSLEKEQKLTDDIRKQLDDALDDFGKLFAPGGAQA